jgi:hypothetical protein
MHGIPMNVIRTLSEVGLPCSRHSGRLCLSNMTYASDGQGDHRSHLQRNCEHLAVDGWRAE